MDPFTIVTGLGGLLSLTIQITQLLTDYASSVQDAPIFATEVAGETSALSLILKELQEFLRDAHEKSETKVDSHSLQQILGDCKATMLQLDAQMTGLKGFGTGKQLKQRFKWAYKEAAITRILVHLQNHKRSLTLLLQLYVCKSTIEASRHTPIPQFTCAIIMPEYDDYLKETRVYRHAKRKDSIDSKTTTDTRQTAWSRFPESVSSGQFSTYAFYSIPWTDIGTESMLAHELDPDVAWARDSSNTFAALEHAWYQEVEAAARLWNHVTSPTASPLSGAHPVPTPAENEAWMHGLSRIPTSAVSYRRALGSWITNESVKSLSVRDAILMAEKAKLF